MSDYVLRSIREAETDLARLFHGHVQNGDSCLRLEIREDICFRADTWVSVGTISSHPEVRPEPLAASQDITDERLALQTAFRYGFFDWCIPEFESLQKDLTSALVTKSKGESSDKKSSGAAKAIAYVAMRCGLTHPVFDAMALSKMPFQEPIGIVADTNAVLQGALDFVARHLTPAARIVIPAMVHMEILNFVDRYFIQRYREKKPGAQMLQDHALSQAGQRALLRLEQQHHVERPRVGADPLRGIIQPQPDAEDKNLGLQQVQRSFADRLILETAVQRRASVNYPIMLMTADQGLARMALAEGIEPLFFDNAVSHVFGSTLSGVVFRPFTTAANRAYSVSVADVLWELSVTFGAARVVHGDSGSAFEVASMGEGCTWQPYHSHDDLLWTRVLSKVSQPKSRTEADEVGSKIEVSASRERPAKSGSYVFSLGAMVRLMWRLSSGPVGDVEGMNLAKVNKASAYSPYRRFLTAGGFAMRDDGILEGTELLNTLIGSMTALAFTEMQILLTKVESFGQFLSLLKAGEPLTLNDSGLRNAPFRAYCALAEMCCAGVRLLGDDGIYVIYATPENPPPEDFARTAVEAYDAVRQGEAFALTGTWLEYLAKRSGIHPVRACQRLAEAYHGGYLRRFFEGSTPETRYEKRNIQVLYTNGGIPEVQKVNLYHGDFLMPGRASGSVRVLRGDNEPS